jgi:hypothetical protein
VARRVWLHVGCPKTGTSFLQSLIWNNRACLKEQGITVPCSPQTHYRASLFVRGAHETRATRGKVALAWQRLVRTVRHTRGDVLISHELFAPASAQQARFLIETLGAEETHVIITARDLARQVPASWQQGLKHGSAYTLEEFARDVMSRGPLARRFWRMQDVAKVAARWGDSLPDRNVHLVTVPPKGADPALLWERFASVIGVDPASVSLDSTRSNESLGGVEAELLRRIQQTRLDRAPGRKYHPDVREMLNGVLMQRANRQRFGIESETYEWIRKTSHDMVGALKQRDYEVRGDLADLIVPAEQPGGGGSSSSVDQEELLASSVETIVDLLDAHREALRNLDRMSSVANRVAGLAERAISPRPRR